LKNDTNLQKYKRLAPFYDFFMGNRLFHKARKQAFSELKIQPKDTILLAGVGTGEDLPFLPKDAIITGIDLSEEMLRVAESKKDGRNITLKQMNAENMNFQNRQFNFIVLNLILSVVENPEKVLEKSLEYLAPDGTILIFDKFTEPDNQPGFFRRLLNKITSVIGTDINRDFYQIKKGLPMNIQKDYKTIGGLYRIIVAQKQTFATANDISV
jgi:phosphatidylethanolamine/phosphatidyl-N-methylethanolamine N-methyltransferase